MKNVYILCIKVRLSVMSKTPKKGKGEMKYSFIQCVYECRHVQHT